MNFPDLGYQTPQQQAPQPVGNLPQTPPPPPAAVVYAPPPFAIGGGRDPRLKSAERTLNRMCMLVLLQTAASVFFELLFVIGAMALRVNLLSGDDMAFLWLTAAMVPLSTALPFFLYLLFGKADVSDCLRFEKVKPGTAALCVAVGLGVCMLANYPAFFVQAVLGNFGYEASPSVTQGDSLPTIVLELFSLSVLVPVMEEFAFRGVIFSCLRKYGTAFAVVASAIVFALVHLDISNVIFALIAGLAFGFLYARTGNLWVSVIIHGLNNGIAVLTSHGEFLFGGMAQAMDLILTVFPIFLGVAAFGILLGRKRDWLFGRCAPPVAIRPLSGGETAGCIVRAPALWLIVGMMLFYTVTLFF